MTEQETMIRLDFIRCALLGGTKPEIIPNEDNVELMDNAIKALEEIQQYRAIGTPEECQAAVEKQKEKRCNISGDGYANGYLVYDTYECPNCGKEYEIDYDSYEYCPNCGQHMLIELESDENATD